MTFFPKPLLIAGLEVTSTCFKLALIKKKRKGWEVVQLEEFPLDSNPLETLPKEAIVVTSLPSREVLIRPLDIPLKKEKDIEAAYEFQTETLLPYPIEKAIVQKITVKHYAEGTLLTILSAKKDHLDRHLSFLKERGIEPLAVTCIPVALAALGSALPKNHEPFLWIEMGQTEGTVALVEGGKLLTARAFEVDPTEIQKSVLSILANYKTKKIDTIFLIAEDPKALAMVEELTEKTVLLPKIPLASEEALQKYGIALGLALAASVKQFPNFRAKEKNFTLQWKRVKKPLLTYFALTLLLFVTLNVLTKRSLSLREEQLLNQSHVLFTEGASSVDELHFKLEKVQAEIDKIPDTFPLHPQIPKVRDLLAYFSEGPWFVNERGEKLMEIEKIHYMMISRPDFNRKEEKYNVKVELVFTCTQASSAHAFHEALLSGLSFVDTKKEVEWIPGKGKYKTTFYLKDKTRYS